MSQQSLSIVDDYELLHADITDPNQRSKVLVTGRNTTATLDEHQEAVDSLAGCNTPDSIGFIMFSKYPS